MPPRASLSSERLWSGYVMPLALVSGIKEAEAEPHLRLVKQLLYSGIVKDLGCQIDHCWLRADIGLRPLRKAH